MKRLLLNLAAAALRRCRRAPLPKTGSDGRDIFQRLEEFSPAVGNLRRGGFQSLEKFAAVVLSASALAISAQAQFAIPWSRTAGGGVTSATGGTFTAGSTSGQSDTGVSTGGTQRVVGGFWAIMDADMGPPQLISNGTVVSNLPDALVVSAEVVSHNVTTYVWLEWGATVGLGNSGPLVNAGRKFAVVTVFPGFSGTLLPGGTYYYRLVASNSEGVVYGVTQSFVQPLFVQTSAGLPAVANGGMIWGDYDNDGLLDVFVHGLTSTGRITQVWRNTGIGTFTNINAGLTPVSHGAAAWGDYNNDGQLDILMTGDTGTGLVAQVWRNTGSGFSNIVAGLPGVSNSAVAWADFNNDGLRDLVIAGMTATGQLTSLWRNTGAGFSNVVQSIPGLDAAAVAAADYDNDGWTDLYVQGLTGTAASSAVGQFWRNVPGTMTLSNAYTFGAGRYFGTASWIDRDGNVLPDILRTGINPSGNDAVTQTQTNSITAFNGFGTPGPNLRYSGASWCDYNADGYGDLVIWGQSLGVTNVAQIWQKQVGVSTVFTNAGFVIPGIAFGSGAWADYDNDGRPDLLMSGQMYSGGTTSYLLQGLSPSNAVPTTPTGLAASVATNGVTLAWTTSTDALMSNAGLSYNIRVGSSPGGSDLFDPQANPTNGFRRVAELGNVYMGTNAFLAFTNSGIYFWSVQAIDNAFMPSTFAGERAFGIALPAFVTTQPPTFVDKSNATFNASINVSHTTAWFEYGTTTNYGSTSTATSVSAITNAQSWSLAISNLQPATIYHYRAVGTNVIGRENGSNVTFQTRGPAVAFAIQTQPSSVSTAGVNFVQQPVLWLVDALGAIDTGAVHAVTVSTASGTGTLLGSLTVNAVTGVVKFTNLSYTNAGVFTLAFSAAGLTGATSTPLTVNAAAANRFVVSAQPSAAVTAGVAFVSQPALRVEDPFGNLVVTGNIPVSIGTVSNTARLVGVTNTISTNGLAAFAGLNFTNAGTHTLRFTNSVLANSTVTSTPVSVVASFATKLVMSNQPPANAIAGAAFSPAPVVRLEDAHGNISLTSAVTVVAAVASGPGPIVGTTGVVSSAGAASFANLFGTNVGTYTVGFTCGTLQGVTSTAVTIRHAAVTKLSIQTQPSATATAAVSFAQQPVIRLEDAFGNVATGANNQVSAGTATGIGILQGGTNATMTNGIATFVGLNYTNAGAFTIGFAAAGLAGTTSTTVNVGANFARTLVMFTQPSGVTTAGVAWVTQSVVRIEDGYGNLVSTGNISVGATTASGDALIQGSTNTVSTNGFAAYAGQFYTNAGTFSLAFAVPGFTGTTSTPISVVASFAARLGMSNQPPANAIAGTAFSPAPIVRAEDIYGNASLTTAVTIVAAVAAGPGPIVGTTSVVSSAGISTFSNLFGTSVGTYTVGFTCGTLQGVTSTTVTIRHAAVTKLSIQTQPSATATAAVSFAQQPVIRLEDAFGNVATGANNQVSGGTASGVGILQGSTNAAMTNGMATFSGLNYTNAGAFTIRFAATGLTGATSTTVTVGANFARTLVMHVQPSSVATAGVAWVTQAVVRIEDGYGNSVSTGNIAVGASTAGALLQGSTNTVSTNGLAAYVGQFLTNAGTYSLTFSVPGFTGVTSTPITVAAAAPARFTIGTAVPAQVLACEAISPAPSVQLQDAFGNVTPSSSNLVQAVLDSGVGPLYGTTATNAVSGVATFTNLAISATGTNYRIRFEASGFVTLTSSVFTVIAGQPAQLVLITNISPVATAGVAFATQPFLMIYDNCGNFVSTATNTVTAARQTGGGTLQGDTVATAVGGKVSFTNLFHTYYGTNAFVFTSPGLASVNSAVVTTRSSFASQLFVYQQPTTNPIAGQVFPTQAQVIVIDSYFNFVSTGNVTVTASTLAGSGLLRGPSTTVTTNGVGTFIGQFYTNAGGNIIQFQAGGYTTAYSSIIQVLPAAATNLYLALQPTNAGIDAAIVPSPQVYLRDPYFNLATLSTVMVTAAWFSGPGNVLGSTQTLSVAGIATFTNLYFTNIGPYQITYSSPTCGSVTSPTIVAAVGLAVQTQASVVVTAGISFVRQPVVRIEKSPGVVDTNATNIVTAATSTGAGELQGVTSVRAVAGLATFTDLYYTNAGTFTLSFTGTNLSSTVSSSLVVQAAGAARLGVSVPPSSISTAGVAFVRQPVARIEDAFGNLQSNGTYAVTARNFGGTQLALGGTTSESTNGLAPFAGLYYTNAGLFALQFTNSVLTSGVSGGFLVMAAAPARLVVNTEPAAQNHPCLALNPAPAAHIEDGFGNTVSNSALPVSAALASGSGPLTGTINLNASSGLASFSDLVISITGANYRIRFDSAGIASVTSQVFGVFSLPYRLSVLTNVSAIATAGVRFAQQPSVRVLDACNNLVADATNLVQASVYTGAGSLSGQTSLSALNGVVNFTNLNLTLMGSNTLVFQSAGLLSVETSVVTTRPSFAARLLVSRQPSPLAIAGVQFVTQAVVQVTDSFYNPVSTGSIAVTASNLGPSAILRGPSGATTAGGLGTFAGQFYTNAGDHRIEFLASGFGSATSDVVHVDANTASYLAIGQFTTNIGIDSAIVPAPTINLLDAHFNQTTQSGITVTAARFSGPGNLHGTTQSVSAVGIASFPNLFVTNVGNYRFTFASPGFGTVTSATISATVGLAMLVQPSLVVTAGVVFARQPQVRIETSPGVVNTSATNVVVATTFTGTGELQGVTAVQAVAGVATFSGLYYTNADTFSIRFTSSNLTGVASTTLLVRAAAASKIGVSIQPSAIATAGVVFVTQPMARMEDAYGNLVTNGNITVTANSASSPALLQGPNTSRSTNGLAPFVGLYFTNAGGFNLSFTNATLTAGTSASVLVMASAPVRIGVTEQPADPSPPCVLLNPGPAVELQDLYGNTVLGQEGKTFTATLATGPGSLSGTTNVDLPLWGNASFYALSISTTGTGYRIRFSTSGYAPVTSTVFAVQSFPYQLVLITNVSTVSTAGVRFAQQPTLQIVDSCGNFLPAATSVVHAATYTGTGTLLGDNVRTAVNGIVTFTNLNYTVASNKRILFSSPWMVGVQSASVLVRPAAAAKLGVSRAPSASVTAGVVFPIQSIVRVTDAFDNFVTNGNHSISSVTLSDPALLQGPLTTVTTNGLGNLIGQYYTNAGSHQIEYSAAGLSAISAPVITVVPAAAVSLAILSHPLNAPSGQPISPSPELVFRDTYFNTATLGGAVVTAARFSGPAALIGTTQEVSVVGTATFTNLIMTMEGDHRIVYSSPGFAPVTSAVITALASVPYRIGVHIQPSLVVTAGVDFAQQPQARMKDFFYNNVLSATDAVSVSVFSGPGSVSGTTTLTPETNGIVVFTNLVLTTAGNNIVLSFDNPYLEYGTSLAITVVANPTPSQIGTHIEPSLIVTAGVSFAQQPVARVEDAYGNFIASGSYSVAIQGNFYAYDLDGFLTIADRLYGTTNFTTVAGLATFTNLSLRTAATYTFNWRSSGLGFGFFPEYWTVSVMPAAASHLRVANEPDSVTAGTYWSAAQIGLYDTFTNFAAASTADVTASVVSGPGLLLGTLTTRSTNGFAIFSNLYATNAGSFVLRYSAPGLGAVTGGAITVESGPAVSMLVATQASAVATGGVPFVQQPVIRLLDAYGNLLSQPQSQVNASMATGPANTALGGDTNVYVMSGHGSFTDLFLNSNGTYKIRFDYGSLPAVTSAVITVMVGPPTGLIIVTQPTAVVSSGVAFPRQPVLHVVDDGGNLVTAPSQRVFAVAETGPGALLGVTNTISTNGVVRFTGLYLSNGGAYTLGFSYTDSITLAISDYVTIPAPPTVTTLEPTAINLSSERLNGSVIPNLSDTTFWFEWGLTAAYGTTTTPINVGSGVVPVSVFTNLGGLSAGATYYYRAVASNALGKTFGAQQSFTVYEFGKTFALFTGLRRVISAWGDFDNDGLMDFVVSGVEFYYSGWATPNFAPRLYVYRNTGSNFVWSATLSGLGEGDIALADYDRDGFLDILVNGLSSYAVSGTWGSYTPVGSQPRTYVIRNTGSGFAAPITSVRSVYNGSAAWADYDNDGRPDAVLNGKDANGTRYTEIYRNLSSSFSYVLGFTGVDFGSALTFGDYDNDHDPDLFLMGWNGSTGVSQIYRNEYPFGYFTSLGSGLTGNYAGDAAWADRNNDGWLDLAQIGSSGNFVPRGNSMSNLQNGAFTSVYDGLGFGYYFAGLAWGDFNNDGARDLLVNGWNGVNYDWSVRRNTNGVFLPWFSNTASTVSAFRDSVATVDYDNDGRLDIINMGDFRFEIWRNFSTVTNSRPSAPANLAADSYTGSVVTLFWSPSTDEQTPSPGLTYNIAVGRTSGVYNTFSPMASTDGVRRIAQDGNVGHGTTMVLRSSSIGSGIFFWRVQAIDSAYAGSEFSEERAFGLGLPVIIRTANPTSVTSFAATMGGTMVFSNGVSRGWIEWGTNASLGLVSSNVIRTNATTALVFAPTNLERGVTYFYRAVASNVLGVITGAMNSFNAPIVIQGFEGTNTDNWPILSGPGRTNLTGTSDAIPNRRILTGSYSWQPGSLGTGVQMLELDEVNVSGYGTVTAIVRFSTSGYMGSADRLQIFAALDGAAISTNVASAAITINGNGNTYWSYDATNVITTTVGTPASWTASGTGNRTALDGRATARIVIPAGTKSVRLSIKSTLTSSTTWCVDDIRIEGNKEPDTAGPFFYGFTVNGTNTSIFDSSVNTFTVRVSAVDGPNGISLTGNVPTVTITNPVGQLVYGPTPAITSGFTNGAQFLRMTNIATGQSPVPGTYVVAYSANDLAGQLSRTSFTFVVADDDSAAPLWTPGFVGVPSGWINTNRVLLSWNAATDNQGIFEYRVKTGNAPTGITEGVSLGLTRTQFVTFAEGITTNWFFAVDNDNDSPADGRMSTSYAVIVQSDTTAPAKVTGFASGPVSDNAIQISLRWNPVADAGGPYSTWASYDIFYTTNNATPDASSPSFNVSHYDVLGTNTTANLLLTPMDYDQLFRFAIAGRDAAGNRGTLSTALSVFTGNFAADSALVLTNSGVQIIWNARTDVAYDVLWQDATVWRDSLTNTWQLLAAVTNSFPVDTGSVTRTPPLYLGGSTMRFYRVSNPDLWDSNAASRIATREIIMAKPLVFVPGENWTALFATPISNTVAGVFGTNQLPAGTTLANAAKISWYASSNAAVATNVIWLSTSGNWVYSIGGTGPANDLPIPPTLGFNVEIPGTATQRLVVLGRLSSVTNTFGITAGSPTAETYNLRSITMPRRTTIAETGLKSALVAGINITAADEIRVLDNSAGIGTKTSPKYRIWLRSTDNTFRYTPGSASAEAHIFEPGDTLVIIRRNAGSPTVTNRLYFTAPGKNINP